MFDLAFFESIYIYNLNMSELKKLIREVNQLRTTIRNNEYISSKLDDLCIYQRFIDNDKLNNYMEDYYDYFGNNPLF